MQFGATSVAHREADKAADQNHDHNRRDDDAPFRDATLERDLWGDGLDQREGDPENLPECKRDDPHWDDDQHRTEERGFERIPVVGFAQPPPRERWRAGSRDKPELETKRPNPAYLSEIYAQVHYSSSLASPRFPRRQPPPSRRERI